MLQVRTTWNEWSFTRYCLNRSSSIFHHEWRRLAYILSTNHSVSNSPQSWFVSTVIKWRRLGQFTPLNSLSIQYLNHTQKSSYSKNLLEIVSKWISNEYYKVITSRTIYLHSPQCMLTPTLQCRKHFAIFIPTQGLKCDQRLFEHLLVSTVCSKTNLQYVSTCRIYGISIRRYFFHITNVHIVNGVLISVLCYKIGEFNDIWHRVD